ncbi:hypothetical protein LCGC14_0401460 [marine sediment metagenome]|uniref:Uncharacterized protein n=1 Tax=marine sediment metagenome TaxID=412755 RepID=A0A0F9W5Q0_9ZZZZ
MPDVELFRQSDGEIVGRVSFEWIDPAEFTIENIRVRVPRPLYRFAVVDNLANPNLHKPVGGVGVRGVGIYYEVLQQVMLDVAASLKGIDVRFPTKRKLPKRISEADSAPLLET